GPRLYIFTKTASSEGSNYVWTISASPGSGAIVAYTGTNISFDAIGSFSNASSTSSISTSVTANAAGTLIIAADQNGLGSADWTAASGWVKRVDVNATH